jgi:hypothetical protein
MEIRVIRKVRKTQHQNPEFGHTQGGILKKKPEKKYMSIHSMGDRNSENHQFW